MSFREGETFADAIDRIRRAIDDIEQELGPEGEEFVAEERRVLAELEQRFEKARDEALARFFQS